MPEWIGQLLHAVWEKELVKERKYIPKTSHVKEAILSDLILGEIIQLTATKQ